VVQQYLPCHAYFDMSGADCVCRKQIKGVLLGRSRRRTSSLTALPAYERFLGKNPNSALSIRNASQTVNALVKIVKLSLFAVPLTEMKATRTRSRGHHIHWDVYKISRKRMINPMILQVMVVIMIQT
jgi:hypothetical protein